MTMKQDDLRKLSSALKTLHRAHIQAEIGDDPVFKNPYDQLFALINDPRFSWMGVLSRLIAEIDHQIDGKDEDEEVLIADPLSEAEKLVTGSENGAMNSFRLKHLMALQSHPDVGLASGQLRRLFTEIRADVGNHLQPEMVS